MIDIRDTTNELPEDKDVEIILNDYNRDFCNEFMNMSYDKRIFKNNINNLNYISKSKEDLNETFAQYLFKNNTIEYRDEQFKNTICHELLHMSSTVLLRDRICSGFMQKCGNSVIGIGINEGFTSYFDDKYFSKFRDDKNELRVSYLICKDLVSYFDEFIPVEEMAEYYFKADLFGLIMRLSKYVDPRRVVRMIIAFDFIHEFESGKNKNIYDVMIYHDYVMNFLIEYNLNVLNAAYYSNKVSNETYLFLLEQIKELTKVKIHPKGVKFINTKVMSNRRFKHFNDNSKRYVLSKLNK